MTSPIALITGANRGLGKSTALRLASRGVDVIVTYNTHREEADQVVRDIEGRGGRGAALQLNMANSSGFAEFANRFQKQLSEKWQVGHFNYLVNNAGQGAYASFAETTEEQFDDLMRVHLKGPFFLTQALLPMIADGGRIVNLSSGLTRFSLSGYAAYAVMKGGVEVLTRYLASELGPRGIGVNTMAPGAIETDFGGGAVRDNAELNAMLASQTALGRVGLPDDVGGAISALLDSDNNWVNGQRIEVSGGIHL